MNNLAPSEFIPELLAPTKAHTLDNDQRDGEYQRRVLGTLKIRLNMSELCPAFLRGVAAWVKDAVAHLIPIDAGALIRRRSTRSRLTIVYHPSNPVQEGVPPGNRDDVENTAQAIATTEAASQVLVTPLRTPISAARNC